LQETRSIDIIVPITKQDTYATLFEQPRVVGKPEDLQFESSKTALVEALIAKEPKTLLLKGEFNSELTAMLASAGAKKSYLWINGAAVAFSERIILLTEDKDFMPFAWHRSLHIVNSEDYAQYLAAKFQSKITNYELCCKYLLAFETKIKQKLSYSQLITALTQFASSAYVNPLESLAYAFATDVKERKTLLTFANEHAIKEKKIVDENNLLADVIDQRRFAGIQQRLEVAPFLIIYGDTSVSQ
jgi:hypothetical protein